MCCLKVTLSDSLARCEDCSYYHHVCLVVGLVLVLCVRENVLA